jgi:8-oxo-dGTP pyrophosphatase MutT (NUDIX family)
MTSRAELIESLKKYSTPFNDEQKFIDRFLELLKSPDAYQRTHLPSHITGSAFIIDEERQSTLLTHHAKLNKWLQPGGHADGDENVLGVALREAEEETGLKTFTIPSSNIFDIDIHLIPARKDFPEHYHYDIRFLFIASKDEPLVITEESHDLGWKKITDIETLTGNNPSMVRMAKKISEGVKAIS